MYGRSHLRCHFSGTVSKNNLRFSPIKKKKKETVKWFFSCRYRLKFFVGDHLVSQFNSTQWTNWRMNPLTARMEMESLFANMPASTTTCISPKSSCWEVSKISSETTLSRNVKVTITEIRATRTHEVTSYWSILRRWLQSLVACFLGLFDLFQCDFFKKCTCTFRTKSNIYV